MFELIIWKLSNANKGAPRAAGARPAGGPAPRPRPRPRLSAVSGRGGGRVSALPWLRDFCDFAAEKSLRVYLRVK